MAMVCSSMALRRNSVAAGVPWIRHLTSYSPSEDCGYHRPPIGFNGHSAVRSRNLSIELHKSGLIITDRGVVAGIMLDARGQQLIRTFLTSYGSLFSSNPSSIIRSLHLCCLVLKELK
jgi:hypothetical protein